MIKISLLSVMIGILLIGLSNLHNLAWADAVSNFCYDEIGDNHFCFSNKEDCDKAQKSNQIAESHCYEEDPSLVPI